MKAEPSWDDFEAAVKSRTDDLDFWRCLCLCHDAIQVEDTYQSASLDEVAFLDMAKRAGFCFFKERTLDNRLVLSVNGAEETYELLRLVEFTSERKRMSVVVRRETDGKVFSFIKGGDMVIVPSLTAESRAAEAATIDQMNRNAEHGLRVLMFAVKELDSSLTKDQARDLKVEELETETRLLGVTGLEDVLQDNVAKCIRDFRAADIRVWMLTGDKKETAENVALACGLIDTSLPKVVIDGSTAADVRTQINSASKASQIMTLVSGMSLETITSDESFKAELTSIFERSRSVVIYRCSPNEKAAIVKFVMTNCKDAFTCAIGDGSNDINMI